jgi:multiple sugar transport system permease protein
MSRLLGRNSLKYLSKLAFILPALVYLIFTQAYPLLNALFTSFTDKTIGVQGKFIGLENYIELAKDPIFWLTFRNSFVFTFGAVGLKLLFGMVMALVLNQDLILKNLWRALLFLPWTIATIVTVLMFGFMYSSTGGIFNTILLRSGLIHQPIGWLSTPSMALFSVILVNVWRGTPFFGISILSGLQAVPKEQYEAAELDGANNSQRFIHITLPSIRNVVLLVSVVSTIWTLNDFQIIWILTRGGPVNSTQVFSTLTYTYAFLNLYLAKGIAISITAVPFIFILIFWVTNVILKQEE